MQILFSDDLLVYPGYCDHHHVDSVAGLGKSIVVRLNKLIIEEFFTVVTDLLS